MSEINKSGVNPVRGLIIPLAVIGLFVAIVLTVLIQTGEKSGAISNSKGQKPAKVAPKTEGIDYSVLQAVIDSVFGKAGSEQDFNRKGRWELLRHRLQVYMDMSGTTAQESSSAGDVDDRAMVFHALGVDKSRFWHEDGNVLEFYVWGDPAELELGFVKVPDGVKLYSITFYNDMLTVRGFRRGMSCSKLDNTVGEISLYTHTFASAGQEHVTHWLQSVNYEVQILLNEPDYSDYKNAAAWAIRIYDKNTTLPANSPISF